MTPERIAELRAIIAAASLMDEEVNMGIGKAVTQKEFYQSAKLAFPQALDTIEAQAARIVELEAALNPFADDELHEGLDDGPDDKRTTWPSFRLGDFRAARAALTKGE